MAADDEWKEDAPSVIEPSDDDDSEVLSELERILLREAAIDVEDDAHSVQAPSLPGAQKLSDNSTAPGILEDAPNDKVGGFAFYLSLFALLPSGFLTLVLTGYTWHDESLVPTLFFCGASIVGIIAAKLCIKGRFSVLLHEFKHQIVSNLVGNKAKKLHVDVDSGHFEYAYSKQTSHFNAIISLAPYIVPLFTFVFALLAFAVARHDHATAAWIVGIGYGVDILLNSRDISPVQTDITEIRGGYWVGLLYILAWNLAIVGVLLAWVFHGLAGFSMLIHEFSALFFYLHAWLRGAGVEQ